MSIVQVTTKFKSKSCWDELCLLCVPRNTQHTLMSKSWAPRAGFHQSFRGAKICEAVHQAMLVIVMLTRVFLDQLGFEPRIPATLSPLIGHRSTVVRTPEGNTYEQWVIWVHSKHSTAALRIHNMSIISKSQAGRTLCGNLGFTQQHIEHYIYKHLSTQL